MPTAAEVPPHHPISCQPKLSCYWPWAKPSAKEITSLVSVIPAVAAALAIALMSMLKQKVRCLWYVRKQWDLQMGPLKIRGLGGGTPLFALPQEARKLQSY